MPTTICNGYTRRGSAIVEAAAVVVVGAVLLAMLLVLGGESRRNARLGEDLAKLRQIGAWTGSYGADYSDVFWTFSWKKNQAYVPAIPPANSDVQAAAYQAVEILQRVGGRTDIALIAESWFPHLFYSHLALGDYFEPRLPDLTFVSAGDANRLAWAQGPEGFDGGLYHPAPANAGTNSGKRWPYSSSFQLNTSFFDGSDAFNRIAQTTIHNGYITPQAAILAGKAISSVSFPSQKVHLHDGVGWHFGPRVSHVALPEVRSPLLFADGSVRVHASADANPGWQPNQPANPSPTTYLYQPQAWEPPTLTGSPAQNVFAGRYRWTRGFLDGRDFSGPEACTAPGQPGCP